MLGRLGDFLLALAQFGTRRIQRQTAAENDLVASRRAEIITGVKPRRFRPSTLMPTGRQGLPAASTNGGESCISELLPPVMLCAPMRENWCTPVRPPMIAQSPT